MAMRHKKPEQRADSRIFLRPFKQSDGLKIYNLAKEKRVAEWTMFIPHPCPKGWAKKYIFNFEPALEMLDQLYDLKIGIKYAGA